MYSKESTRIEPLTLELAKEVAALRGLPGEREIKPVRLTFLKNHLKEGSFVGPNWATAVCRADGERYRINGQHSSHLLADLKPEQFPAGLNVTIDNYEFDDMRDAAGMFNLFDHPRSARTDSDFMGISKAQYSEFAEMDNRFLMRVAAGIDVNLKLRLEKKPASPEAEQQRIILPHREQGYYFGEERYRHFAVWLYQWRESKHFGFVGRAGVTSAILDEWSQSVILASEFWGFVFHENHPDPDHESRQLVDELKALGDKPKKVTATEYQKKTGKFWSKYYRLRLAEKRGERAAVEAESQEGFLPITAEAGAGVQPQL